jgi:hypothetical protein
LIIFRSAALTQNLKRHPRVVAYRHPALEHLPTVCRCLSRYHLEDDYPTQQVVGKVTPDTTKVRTHRVPVISTTSSVLSTSCTYT